MANLDRVDFRDIDQQFLLVCLLQNINIHMVDLVRP